MGQIIALAVRVVLLRPRSENSLESPAMAGRRRRGMAIWLGKSSSTPEDGVSVASTLRDSSQRFLSRHGGRLLGGGRSDSPLSPSAAVGCRSQPRPLRPEMASDPTIRLSTLNRNFDSPVPRSPAPQARDEHEACLAADCCPRCSCVPLWLRRRRSVISLAVIVSIVIGIGGPFVVLSIHICIFVCS